MASIRRVRKSFRKQVLRFISSGDGNIEKLSELAGSFFGNDVGYEVLIKTFLRAEISNAVSFLRNEGQIETIGKQWKPVSELQPADVEVISTRRKKRLRGELKAEIKLAHNHGLIDDAVLASQMLGLLSSSMVEQSVEAEAGCQ